MKTFTLVLIGTSLALGAAASAHANAAASAPAAVAVAADAQALDGACTIPAQEGYEMARTAAAERVAEAGGNADSDLAEVSQLRPQLNAIDFSKFPQSRQPLETAITAVEAQLKLVKSNGQSYLTAFGGGTAGKVLSVVHVAMRDKCTATAASTKAGEKSLDSAKSGLSAVTGPPEAMAMKQTVEYYIERAKMTSDYSEKALGDAGDAHNSMYDCAKQFEKAAKIQNPTDAMNTKPADQAKEQAAQAPKDEPKAGGGLPGMPGQQAQQPPKDKEKPKPVNVVKVSQGGFSGDINPGYH